MTIGEKIAKLRKQSGYSQETLSEKLGVSRQAVSKWENGTAQPAGENLARISKLFGISVSALLDDEDINRGTAEKAEIKSCGRKNKTANIFIWAVLVIANIAQFKTIGGMKSDMQEMKNQVYRISALESEISSLRSYIGSLSSFTAQANKDFTDYQYEIISYDYDLNTALLKFSVVPTDYTRQTQMRIVIKSENHTYTADAYLENDVFVAQKEVLCDGDMAVYLYMTDGGRTRSFVLGYINDPSENYIMSLSDGLFDGDIIYKDGKLNIAGCYNIGVRYAVNKDKSKSVHPQKAVLNIYACGELVAEIFHEEAANYGYQEAAEWFGPYEEKGISAVYFGIYLDETIEADGIEEGEIINFEYVTADTQGREYTLVTEVVYHKNK